MKSLAFAAALLVTALAFPYTPPPAASKLVSEARAQAKRENKNAMVVFHASWCGWCKRFDKMLADGALLGTFDKSYGVVHLDVLENDDKKGEENPGGVETMAALGGKDAGLPFFAILDSTGKKLADSLRTPGNAKTNTGHPAAPEEIAHFMTLLEATGKRMSSRDRDRIAAYLKADAAKR